VSLCRVTVPINKYENLNKVVDRVIGSLLRSHGNRHVLCTGFRAWTGKQNVARMNNGVECFYPNPMVSHIKGTEWERIGEL
jgi:hypothetical protein